MLQTARCYRGMVSAPHHLAARAGVRVLEEGGNAVEAMLAAAATITIAYPHMNGLGGDCFWLIHEPGKASVGIQHLAAFYPGRPFRQACAPAADQASGAGCVSDKPVAEPSLAKLISQEGANPRATNRG